MVPWPVTGQGKEVATLTVADRVHGLSTVWMEARYNFPFFDQVPELDWDAAYRELIPRMLEDQTLPEYFRTLQRFAALLRDGHTRVTGPWGFDTYPDQDGPWILLRAVGRRALIDNVGRGTSGALSPGDELVAVDGVPLREHLEANILPLVSASTDADLWASGIRRALEGPRGSEVTVEVLTAGGERRTARLRRDRESREDTWLRETPSSEAFEIRELDDSVAYIALRSFDVDDVVEGFRASLPRLAHASGVVIDVRGNRGGNTGRAIAIAAHFTRDTLPGERWRSIEHVAAYKAWGRGNPEYDAYWNHDAWKAGQHGPVVPAEPHLAAPVAVLIDEGTRSAAEGFVVFMDQIPGVTLVGRPSNGSTGQPLIVSLAGGGFALIVSKRNTYPDGTEFVGVGIQPDIVVETTVDDVRARRDPVLERARAALRSSASSSGGHARTRKRSTRRR